MISTTLLITIISLVEISVGVDSDDLVVRLNQPNSRIRGHTQKSAKGKTYYAFNEIPYAEPPVGEKRFKAPEPHAGWDGILNTTQNTRLCHEFLRPSSFWSENADDDMVESEDCLLLNVYTPVVPGSNDRLPVYVYIYGGGFVGGNLVRYSPQYLIDGDIVIVMMKYRVGALGFLSTEDGVVSGNMGLKDQHLALQWTYQNIELFGGNPKDIVVGGQSAGSWSSSYQLLSPKNKGLLSGVIQESGSALSADGLYNPHPRQTAFNLAKNLKLPVSTDNTTSLVELLRQVPIVELKDAALRKPNYDGSMTKLDWTPIMEIEDEQSFISSFMHQDFIDGNFNRVPTLLGFCSEEAIMMHTNQDNAAKVDADPSLLIPEAINVKNRTLAGTKIRDVYTSTSFTDDPGAYVRFNSDSKFTRSATRQAKLTSQYVPVYLYQFSYGSRPNQEFPGVGHGGELSYLFGDVKRTNELDDTDIEAMREILLTLWWNFIKYKNPTPENVSIPRNITWPTVEYDNIKYLNINDTVSVQVDPRNYTIVENILMDQIIPPLILY